MSLEIIEHMFYNKQHKEFRRGGGEGDGYMEPKLERIQRPSGEKTADADETIRRKKEAIDRLLDLADARKLDDIYNFILHIL